MPVKQLAQWLAQVGALWLVGTVVNSLSRLGMHSMMCLFIETWAGPAYLQWGYFQGSRRTGTLNLQAISESVYRALHLWFSSLESLRIVLERGEMHIAGSNPRDAASGSLDLGPTTCIF